MIRKIDSEEMLKEFNEDIVTLTGTVLGTAKNYFSDEVNIFLKKDLSGLPFPGIAKYKDELLSYNPGGAELGCENTLSCIEAGLASGRADMVEIDVHLTKDGEVIVCHDPKVNRTTDGRGMIEDMTLEEIKALHIKDRKGKISSDRPDLFP